MTSENNHPEALSFREKLCYGLGDVSNGLAVSSVSVWLLIYLTDVAGLGAFLAGVAVTIGRFWDAVTDPIMGWLTDQTKSRWGKRRPYLLFGAIPYALAYFALWIVPGFESERAIFIYVTIVLLIFNTCLTVVFVPYTSLTAAITTDYNERTSITGFRMVSSQTAFLIGAAIPAVLIDFTTNPETQTLLTEYGFAELFGSWFGGPRMGYTIMAAIFGFIMVASIWTTFLGTKERDFKPTKSDQSQNPFSYASKIVDQLVGNRPFLISVLILLFANCAGTLAAVNLPFYLQYVLGLEKDAQSPIIALLFFMAIISVPFWVTLAKKYGKAEVFKLAMLLYIAVLFLIPFATASHIYPLAIAIGFCHAAALTIPWAIIPDVVEYDELKSGKRREGLFYGGTTFTYKAATGLAFLISAGTLELIGYEPNVEQTATALTGIKILIGPTPAIFLIIAALLANKYPLTAEKHKRIIDELKKIKGD